MNQERGNSRVERAGVRLTSSQATMVINARAVSASNVIGSPVMDRSGKQAGKIEEMMLDLTDGTVSYVVLAVGGILGIGDKFFAVPLTALSLDPKTNSYTVDMDRKELKRLRSFDKDQWPERAEWPPGKR